MYLYFFNQSRNKWITSLGETIQSKFLVFKTVQQQMNFCIEFDFRIECHCSCAVLDCFRQFQITYRTPLTHSQIFIMNDTQSIEYVLYSIEIQRRQSDETKCPCECMRVCVRISLVVSCIFRLVLLAVAFECGISHCLEACEMIQFGSLKNIFWWVIQYNIPKHIL